MPYVLLFTSGKARNGKKPAAGRGLIDIYFVLRPICTIFAAEEEILSSMKELALKYGCNPNQKPSRIYMEEGELPIEVLNGRPGYINFLDALNSWQLVRSLKPQQDCLQQPASSMFRPQEPQWVCRSATL